MNNIILSWSWYFVVSFSLCAFTPSERPIEGVIEGNGLNGCVGHQIGQGQRIHHSTLSTSPPRMETFDDVRINEGNQEFKSKNSMQESIKALETFVPLNEEVRYKDDEHLPRSFLSKLYNVFIGDAVIFFKMKEVETLCSDAIKHPSSISFMATGWQHVADESTSVRSTLTNEELEQSTVIALEFLQREDLDLYERLWTLCVLKNVQYFLPRRMFKPIRGDPNTGGVCRGGLELFLLEGLDYRPRVKSVINGRVEMFPVDKSVTEALKRVDLIVKIKKYLASTEMNLGTAKWIEIHNQLLRNKSLIKSRMIESLASQITHHAIREDTPDEELECLSNLMQHLDSFYPVAKQFGIAEGLMRVKLIIKIRIYLQESDRIHTPATLKIYNKLLQTKSMDDALIVRALALECLQHMNIKTNPDEDVEFVYDILQYLDTLHPSSKELNTTEALERVQLIMSIRNYIHGFERDHQSPKIMDIHNTLLQTSSLGKPENVESLTSKCIDHMVVENTPDEEVQCCYYVLRYLETFHNKVIKGLIESWSSASKAFRHIKQKFKAQAELQHHIQRYSKKEDKDPYIMSLLLPFVDVGWQSVDSLYVKHCIHMLNIQYSALVSKKGELYGLDVTKGKKYHEDQDFFIEMMYIASTYIKGIQEYLDKKVPKNKQNGHYEFISCVLLTNKNESSETCSICLDGFLKGQRAVRLGCYRPHTLHEQCMNSVISASKGVDVKCPVCRRGLPIPLDQDEYIFWG
ncbi:hypothetical protein DFH28DRAFT_978638 [Melampsora americana]|nr:hypothetical protein DFH28DRAFT_978638 [Melampsora americana]